MLFPEGVAIDGQSGAVSPATGRYTKRLSELRGFYQDGAALERAVAADGDPVAYEVIEYRKAESDLAFGTTIMWPGRVGREFFMTRGHLRFHSARLGAPVDQYRQRQAGVRLVLPDRRRTRLRADQDAWHAQAGG